MSRSREAVRLALEPLRRRNSLLVNLPPKEGMRFGNLIAYAYWAFRHNSATRRARFGLTDAMKPWLTTFPAVAELAIPADRLPLLCQRIHNFDNTFRPADRPQLEAFIDQCLLTAPRWRGGPDTDDDVVTVNVRRGDYYSDPRWKAIYGFDVAAYVRVAIEGSLAQGAIRTVRVVSDGPEWCRENLGFLADYGRLEFQAPSDGPVENLLQLSSARRLVLANSSFSYWAGYMSNTWHGDNHALTWAPWFHKRDFNGGGASQLDNQWSIVRDIPGGW